MSRLWTPELEAKARELKAANKTSQEIADAIGIKRTTVISYFWRHGLGGGNRGGRQRAVPIAPHGESYAIPSVRRFSWERAQ